jgi:hypothetical protein
LNRKFANEVVRLQPALGVVQRQFFLHPVERILTGFVYEQTPSAFYVSHYALPLYDRLEFLHIGFGDRLAVQQLGELWSKKKLNADEFVRTVTPLIKVTKSWQDPATFASALMSPERLQNPWGRRAFALTQIVLGEADQATEQLQILLTCSEIDHLPNFRRDLSDVLEALSSGIPRARALLESWEVITKKRFGLDASSNSINQGQKS